MLIISIGDGEYLRQVIDAIARLHNAGFFHSVGIIGFLLGLLFIHFQGAATGGKQYDLAGLLVGAIIWLVMFGGTTRVTIEEATPGIMRGASSISAVDNVPLGIAVVGSIISRVGDGIARNIETTFGVGADVGGEAGTTSVRGGTGKALQWLAMLRELRFGSLASDNKSLEKMGRDLSEYIKTCTKEKFKYAPEKLLNLRRDAVFLTGGTGEGAFEHLHNFDGGFFYDETTDTLVFRSCAEQTAIMRAKTMSNELATAFAEGVQARFGIANAQSQWEDATSKLGVAAVRNQLIMAALATKALAANQGSLYAGEENSVAMLAQAVEQRAWEFGAEEMLFRRMMQPLMTFLEATTYIASPFACFLLGFGWAGVRMAIKMFILGIFVMLWYPMIAVLNHYQHYMAQKSITMLLSGADGSTAYNMGSVDGYLQLDSLVMEWISTGSLLIASTPMIVLMLIYGTSMTATSLASSLKGSDVTNQKMPAPDLVQPAAVVQNQAAQLASVHGGVVGNQAMPSFDLRAGTKVSDTSQFQSVTQDIASWDSKYGKSATTAVAGGLSQKRALSQQQQEKLDTNASDLTAAMTSAGQEYRAQSSEDWLRSATLATRSSAGAAVSPESFLAFGKAAKAIQAAKRALPGASKQERGRLEKVIADNEAAQQNVLDAVGLPGLQAGASAEDHARLEQRVSDIRANAEAIRAAENKEVKVGKSRVGLVQSGYEMAATGERKTEDRNQMLREVSESGRHSEQIQTSYTQAATAESTVSSNFNMPFNEAAQTVAKNGGEGALRAAFAAHIPGGLGKLDAVTADAASRYSVADREQARNLGMMLALDGQIPWIQPQDVNGRGGREAMLDALVDSNVIPAHSQAAHENGGRDYQDVTGGRARDIDAQNAVTVGMDKSKVPSITREDPALPSEQTVATQLPGGGGADTLAAAKTGANDAIEQHRLPEGQTPIRTQPQVSEVAKRNADQVKTLGGPVADPIKGSEVDQGQLVGNLYGSPMDSMNTMRGNGQGNDRFESLVDTIENGGFAGIGPTSRPVATVLAGMLATAEATGGRGGQLDASQYGQVKDAWDSLPTSQQEMFHAIDDRWAVHESGPSSLPTNARNVLGEAASVGGVLNGERPSEEVGRPTEAQGVTSLIPGVREVAAVVERQGDLQSNLYSAYVNVFPQEIRSTVGEMFTGSNNSDFKVREDPDKEEQAR